LLSKSLWLALGVTTFIMVKYVIVVTLCKFEGRFLSKKLAKISN